MEGDAGMSGITESELLQQVIEQIDKVRADLVSGRALVYEFTPYKTPTGKSVDWSIRVKLIQGGDS